MASKQQQAKPGNITPEERIETVKAIAETIKASKMFQMIICIFLLQGARLYKTDNKCWQGLMTMLQTVCIGGYISSEMEGEIASLMGIGTVGAGTIIGSIQCAEEAGWFPGKVAGELQEQPWYSQPGHPITNLLRDVLGL